MAAFSFASIKPQTGGSAARGGSILKPPGSGNPILGRYAQYYAPKTVQTGPVQLAPGTPRPTTLPQALQGVAGSQPGNPGQAAGTSGTASGTSGPSPLDSTYFNNVATNQFKVNNQLNGLNSNIANQNTALQAALGQLAYQQPRAQLATEQAANRRGALYSTGYNQQLGDLNQKYLTQQNTLTGNEGQKVAALNSQIAALVQGIPLYNQGQALASALRTSTAAANNPATGQPPVAAKPAAPKKVSGKITGSAWKKANFPSLIKGKK